MKRWLVRCLLALFCLLVLPRETPAPLVYRAGEGWSYEPLGGGKWVKTRAKDQLEVAQRAFEAKDYSLAVKAARRVVKVWPLSDFAPQAQFLLGRAYEERKQDEKAFKEYQKLLEKYPKIENYEEVLKRQYAIANRFLGGQWFKLWGHIPFFASMEKTADMFGKVIKNGPYSDIAPQAQMNIGAAHENKKIFWFKAPEYLPAVKAYQEAADRYYTQDKVVADALYKAGIAYQKQAKTAEYDQSAAGSAIDTLTDFVALFPEDSRVPEAKKLIASLKAEQARGSYAIARFYEKSRSLRKRQRVQGALVYYNEVLNKDLNSPYAQEAKERIAALRREQTQAAP